MSLRVWDERVVPRLTDLSLRGHEVGEMRAVACSGLTGRVLEIGFGSGLNVRWYPPEVASVTAIEPSDLGWRLSERRRTRTQVRIERAGLDGQRLDLPDQSHEQRARHVQPLHDPRPVAGPAGGPSRGAPGRGRLHALEHGLAPDESVRRWQRRMEPLQRAVAGGCHLTRDIPLLVEQAGWQVEETQREYLPGPAVSRPWAYGYRLVAG